MVDDDDERTQHKGACIERLKKKERANAYISGFPSTKAIDMYEKKRTKKKNRPNKTTDALTLKKEKIRQRES
jgi:hypothetical protein